MRNDQKNLTRNLGLMYLPVNRSRQRASRVRPADQRARAVRGLGGGRKQLEGGGARGAVRHSQGKGEQVSG